MCPIQGGLTHANIIETPGMNVTGGYRYSKKCPVEHLSCALLADAYCDLFGINTLGSIVNNSRRTEIEVWFLFDNLNREPKSLLFTALCTSFV